jgi:hypothetical protein
LQVVGVIGAVGAVAAVWNAVQAWRAVPVHTTVAAATSAGSGGESVTSRPSVTNPQGWFWGKIFATTTALACIALAWFFIYWNLLDFKLNY